MTAAARMSSTRHSQRVHTGWSASQYETNGSIHVGNATLSVQTITKKFRLFCGT